MEKYQINCPDSLCELAELTSDLLNEKIDEYKLFFQIDEIGVVKCNYFDDLTEFREFIYELRGERESLPEYARGTYDGEMINAYIEPKNQKNRLYTASHELFHILYLKYILHNDYSKRIVWYDEGMAQFMSGEKRKLSDEQRFKLYYNKVRKNTLLLPNMNELEHGNSFCNNQYDGYDLCYLAIKYLSEILDNNEFRNLMFDFDKIKKIGINILNDMFDYYDNKYLKVENRKNNNV